WTVAAADAARAQLAWGLAADGYARAIDLAPQELPLDELRARHADALLLGGKLAEAAAELEALPGDGRRVRAAEAYIKLGDVDRGLALLDDVLVRHGHRRAVASRPISAARGLAATARWLLPRRLRRDRPVDDDVAAAYRVIASFLSTPYPLESFEYVMHGIQ